AAERQDQPVLEEMPLDACRQRERRAADVPIVDADPSLPTKLRVEPVRGLEGYTAPTLDKAADRAVRLTLGKGIDCPDSTEPPRRWRAEAETGARPILPPSPRNAEHLSAASRAGNGPGQLPVDRRACADRGKRQSARRHQRPFDDRGVDFGAAIA